MPSTFQFFVPIGTLIVEKPQVKSWKRILFQNLFLSFIVLIVLLSKKKIFIRAVSTVRIICYNFLPNHEFLVNSKLNFNCRLKLDKMTKTQWLSLEFIKYALIFRQKTVTKTYLAYSMIGIRIGLILPQTNETSVAKICPTSAITDRISFQIADQTNIHLILI